MVATGLRKLTAGAVVAGGAVCLAVVLAQAQGATPKLPDGHPDLNGMWYHRIGAPAPQVKPGESYDAVNAPRGQVTQYPVGRPKYKPEFVAKVKDLDERQVDLDPAWYCQPPGVPRIGPPQKIIQTSKEIVFLYDDLSGNFFRVVRMNAAHRTDIDPSAHGDSIGRWEGDTLVVDVTNLDETTWLTDNGAFHSDKTHVVERLRRTGDSLRYEVTIEDPILFVEPWVQKPRDLKLMTSYDIEEAPFCAEKDRSHMQDLSHHGNIR